MKPLITFAILLILAYTAQAKSLYRLSSDRFVHFPVGLSRCRLQVLKPQPSRNPCELASIALSQCPGTTGKCLKAVRLAVQKSKGMPLVGECLSAKNYGPILVEKYQALRLPISNPSKAPIGSIIVYAPKKGCGHGHIEIVTSKGFVSDHLAKRPYSGNVLGVYAL